MKRASLSWARASRCSAGRWSRAGRATRSGVTATTNDRGDYRAGGLEPGAYVVGVLATSTTLPLDTLDEYNAASGEARTELQRALFAAAPTMTRSAPRRIKSWVTPVAGGGSSGRDARRRARWRLRMYPTAFHGGASQIGEAEVVSRRRRRTACRHRRAVAADARVSCEWNASDERRAGAADAAHAWPANLQDANPAQPVGSTVSDASGRFTFLAMPPGAVPLRAINEPPARSGGRRPLPHSGSAHP